MKTKLLTAAFLLSLLFGESVSAQELPACNSIGTCTKQIPCDESKTPGGGDGPGPGRCWDDCYCSKGRHCNFDGANQETGRCEDGPPSKGSNKSTSKGLTPKK